MKKLVILFTVSVMLVVALGMTPAPAAAQGSRLYVVQPGDTLGIIAWRFGTTAWAIASANSLANPNLIFAGQVLVIPAGGAAPPAPPSGRPTYVVRFGDNLFRIGLAFGWDVNTMAGLNRIPYPYTIFPGQVLLIPVLRYHTVQWGQTVSGIAAAYGSTVGAIVAANGLYNPNIIRAGQVLIVP